MAKSLIPVLVAGAAAVAVMGKMSGGGRVSPGQLDQNGLPEKEFDTSIVVSYNAEHVKVPFAYDIKVIDPFLNARRLEGKLLTRDYDGDFIDYLWKNPTTFFGEALRGVIDDDENRELAVKLMYGSLFAMATFGVGGRVVYTAFTSFKSAIMAGASAALKAGSGSSAMVILWKATQAAASKVKGWTPSVVTGASLMSAAGALMVSDNPDLAASAVESMVAFEDQIRVQKSLGTYVDGKLQYESISISNLPDTGAVMELRQMIHNYVFRFQSSEYEE